MRRAGVDYFGIRAITGHWTMDVFIPFHTIGQNALCHAVRPLDTYMATTPASPTETIHNTSKR